MLKPVSIIQLFKVRFSSLVTILENSRLDKTIREEVRKLWKDFVRSDEGPTASEMYVNLYSTFYIPFL